MAYNIKYGDIEKTVLNQMIKNGENIPDVLLNKPELKSQYLYFYLHTFRILESERPASQYCVMPIPITKIIEYGNFLNLGYDELNIFIHIIKEIDDYVVDYWNDKMKNERNKKKVK